MKILVAGGCGFSGTDYIRYVLENHPEDEIICADISELREGLLEYKNHPKFSYRQTELTDKDAVYKLFEDEKPNAVINFATIYGRSQEFTPFAKSMILSTTTLLDACCVYGVDRFHQVSSGEVYGELPLAKEKYYTEKSSLRPVNQVSATLASADLLAMSYHDTFHLPVTISRSVNLYGPQQQAFRQIPSQILKVLQDEEIDIYGSGADVRDWLYVRDHSEAVDLILRKGKVGEIYNIGSHNEIRSIYITKIILNELAKDEDLIVYKENRRGEERRNALDYSKIEKLGWEPKVEFTQGLKETIAWYADNEK